MSYLIPKWLSNPASPHYLSSPEETVSFLTNPGRELHWKSNPGPQTWALKCPYDEIILGGSRGGGKSAVLIAWFAMGDMELAEDDPAKYSFLNDPNFRGLMLREEYQNMAEFVEEAREFFRPFGCTGVDKPTIFNFKSGARIYTNHLGDEEAYNKYRGWNLAKIGVEELTQIPTLKRYLKLLGSLRSTTRIIRGKEYPKLRAQIGSTTNPDGPGACVPYGEVMTPSGWVDIKKMKVGDPVFTVTPTGQLTVSAVEQVHAGPRSGDMCYVQMRGFHMACTPDHTVAKISGVRQGRNTRNPEQGRPFSLVQFKDLPGQAQILRTALWEGVDLPEFEAPICETRERRNQQPKKLPANVFCRLLGWFLSEGHCVDRDKAFGISQKKPVSRETLRQFLVDCGFKVSWSASAATIYAPDWWLYFRQFGKCADKFIPEWVKAGSKENLEHLFDSLMEGDGHWETKGSGGCYYTISKQLADDVCEIAIKLGFQVYVSRRVRHHSDNITYQVSVKKTKLGGVEFQTGNHVYDVDTSVKKQPAVEIRHSNKPVYCIGVPETHTFFIRQHGAVWVSGNSWVKSRFIEVDDKDGNRIPWNTPMYDPNTGLKRIFIPMRITDNPYLSNDRKYMGNLLAQDEVTRAQWIDGDWNASAGLYFRDYRPTGPRGQEESDKYPWAKHIVEPGEGFLQSWWYRWGSLDIGYDHPAAAHKYCKNESDKRIHVYDELVVRQVGSYELGVMLAKWWLPELEMLPDHQITMYLSPDAFSKTDDARTRAEQLEAGIKEILGPMGALLLRYNEDEKEALKRDPKMAALRFEQRKQEFSGKLCIAIKAANNNRIDGWSYMRDLMRFRPVLTNLKPDQEHLKLVLANRGVEAYEAELAAWRELKPEVLPKVKLWRICAGLDRFLRIAEHDVAPRAEDVRKWNAEDGVGGDDCGDGARYGLVAYREIEAVMPKSYWIAERMNNAQAQFREQQGSELTDVTRLMQIQRQQAHLYDKSHAAANIKSVTIPRAGSMRHRTN